MGLLKIPYLPQTKVTMGIGDIKCENIEIVPPCDFLNLPEGLKRHADLSFCYLGEGVAVCAKGSGEYYQKKLNKTQIMIIEGGTTLDRHYPLDAAYNVAILGKKMFCKKDISDKTLLNEAEKLNYKIVDIKQGYGKCSVCPVDENSAISADVSFARAAEKEGIDVLLITNDTIVLPMYNNGFFGGSAFMADKNTLIVNGDINLHPDSDRIKAFLEKRNIKINCTKAVPLFDFGSFIPLWEE